MAIMEMFTSSFLMSVMFVCVIISLLVIYINYKMSEQDHKISSMLALISTMAQELDFFRRKMLNTPMSSNVSGGSASHHNMSFELEPNNKLIEVSDEDSHSYDDEDDDDDSQDEDADSDDDDDDDDADSDDYDEDKEHENVKVLNIHLGNDQSIHMLDATHFKKLDSDNDENESEDDADLEDDIISINSNDIPNITSNTSTDLKDTIHLEELMSNNTNLQFLNTVDIKSLVNNDDNINHTNDVYPADYKKMSIQKLRSIAIEKGIHVDVSKMKKNEILNLLLNP